MKKIILPLLLLLSACGGTTKFQQIDVGEQIRGNGGVIHSQTENVIVYSSGLPNGALCSPIGIITDSRKDGLVVGGLTSAESAVASEAAKHGANVVSRMSQSTDYNMAAIRQFESQQGQVTINNNITIEQQRPYGTLGGYSSYSQMTNNNCNGIECFNNSYNASTAYQPTYNSQFMAFHCTQ